MKRLSSALPCAPFDRGSHRCPSTVSRHTQALKSNHFVVDGVHVCIELRMKRFCPGGLFYAVIRMDAVAMVEHFNDPVATAAAQALNTKKYLVYLEGVSLLCVQL